MRTPESIPLQPPARWWRPSFARLAGRHVLAALGFLLTSCSVSIPSSSTSASSGQAILDLETAVLQLREDHALLQAEIDSLRDVSAYQDTILRQLAALSNVSMRPPAVIVP